MNKRETNNDAAGRILLEYSHSSRRLILLDYDGTLVPFVPDPDSASPDSVLLGLLSRLASDPKNEVAILSGRQRADLDLYFGDLSLSFSAEHGLWLKRSGGEWVQTVVPETDWLGEAARIIWGAVGMAAGASIEMKSSSVSFHYRNCEEDSAAAAVGYIRSASEDALNGRVSLLFGNKVVEIRSRNVNKGLAAGELISKGGFDFILCCGDDTTDEDMFAALPDFATAVKVGDGATSADVRVGSPDDIRQILQSCADYDRRTLQGGSS